MEIVADENAGFWSAYLNGVVGFLFVDGTDVRDVHLCTDLSSRSQIRLVLVESTVDSTSGGLGLGWCDWILMFNFSDAKMLVQVTYNWQLSLS